MERLRFALGQLGPIALGLIVAVLVAGLYLAPRFLSTPPPPRAPAALHRPAPPAPPPGRPAAPPLAAPQPQPPMDTVAGPPPAPARAPRPRFAAAWLDWIVYQLALMGGMTALTCMVLAGVLLWQSYARHTRDIVEQP
jgi:hypothetical protein